MKLYIPNINIKNETRKKIRRSVYLSNFIVKYGFDNLTNEMGKEIEELMEEGYWIFTCKATKQNKNSIPKQNNSLLKIKNKLNNNSNV